MRAAPKWADAEIRREIARTIPQIVHSAVAQNPEPEPEPEPDSGVLDASREFHQHRNNALKRMLSGMMVHIGREFEPGVDIEKGC